MFLIYFVRHLHEIPRLGRCHQQLVLHLDSEFSSDLRAHCSAIPVSRLLTVLCNIRISIVHIAVPCRFHFSIQVEIENVVFEIDSRGFHANSPISQSDFSFLDQFCTVNRNHVSTVMSELEILSSFARDFCRTAQDFVHSSESSVQRSEQSVISSYP